MSKREDFISSRYPQASLNTNMVSSYSTTSIVQPSFAFQASTSAVSYPHQGSTTPVGCYVSPMVSMSPASFSCNLISLDKQISKRNREGVHSPQGEQVVLPPSIPTAPYQTPIAAPTVVPQHSPSQGADDSAHSAHSSPCKKKRSNHYIAPREIAKTYNSEIGSLAAAAATQATQQQQGNNLLGNMRLNLRRQLSGSKIESYLSNGCDEGMDIDDCSRPRSMSF